MHAVTKAVGAECKRRRAGRLAAGRSGLGQLSLVEHALCPLDRRASLRENLRHVAQYRYADASGRCHTARAVVHCPAGLSAGDEFYLWGLLALTFAQPQPRVEFQATPHFCLRRLGLVSAGSKGGKSYRLFREALRRLAAVRYQNDRFFDPIRREHRAVSFGLLSYSLPLDPASSRAWRIVWDPLFFEFCQAAAGQLRFDLETYRRLDHASRRLFLLLSKVFWRGTLSPKFDVRELAVHGLGFSAKLATRTLKAKVKRCADVLRGHQVLAEAKDARGVRFSRQGTGTCRAQFVRGAYFDRRRADSDVSAVEDSPLFDPLRAIGFEPAAIERIVRRFAREQIQLWADVTLAALEHKGGSFFRRSPQAFFMHNIQHAAREGRTPPDWFWELRRCEESRRAHEGRRARTGQRRAGGETAAAAMSAYRALDLGGGPDELAQRLAAHFVAAGQSEPDARHNAQRFVKELARSRQP